MQWFALGLGLIAVCTPSIAADIGDIPLRINPDSGLIELPLPPEVPPPAWSPILPWEGREAPPVNPRALIRAAARKHRVRAALVISIVAAESNFDPAAISAKGAIGLMQLMPETAELFGADPHDPAANVDAGTHYLRLLIDKYHRYRNWLTRVIAAYNAGPGVVDRYHGVPPYKETKTYVARVLAFMKKFGHDLA